MKVQDGVKNTLAQSDVLHDYWSPLNWLDDKPEKIENAKRQNGKTCKGMKNEIGEEIMLEVKTLEDDMEQLLGEFETINSAANAKLDSFKEQYSQYDAGIVDMGATPGVAVPKDVEQMDPTGEISKKIFILPDGHAVKATNKLTLRHKLQKGALEMNVTPGVHTSLISVCQMADEGYVDP